jgi:hypothetical protein
MKRLLLLLILMRSTVSAGLIFDNGMGDKNDSLVIQFHMPDSTGRRVIDWDTAYVVQAYGGSTFHVDILTSPTNYDIGEVYPCNLMYEYRLRASDSTGHTGAYTWWVYLIETTGGDVKKMQMGTYYVSDDPVESLAVADDIAMLRGGGSEACTLMVTRDSLGPILGARITIRTLNQATTRVPGLFTDGDGRGIAELDIGSYFVSVMANDYVPVTDTLVVGRDSTWTLSMAPYDPADPPSPDLCRVYGWVYDITGDRLSDVTISAEIPSEYHPVKYGSVVITPFEKRVESDSLGYWEIDLFPNEVLSDATSKYLFTIEYPSGVILHSETAVPDSVEWQFR